MLGIINKQPKHVYGPGILCTLTKLNKTVEMIGQKDINIAIVAGSENILVTITKDINVPNVKNIPIKRKFEKCAVVNKPKTPHYESKSKVAPLKKYEEKTIKMQVKRLFKNRSKNGG